MGFPPAAAPRPYVAAPFCCPRPGLRPSGLSHRHQYGFLRNDLAGYPRFPQHMST
ncbi:ORFS340C.iORF1 [Human betaherpesvirus 5]|nr:ORFS340C.iORF1 [Human betaherpesvirus 5]QHX40700.1 ORFS340C.iORF1 [Human betaherpesvirus 5]